MTCVGNSFKTIWVQIKPQRVFRWLLWNLDREVSPLTAVMMKSETAQRHAVATIWCRLFRYCCSYINVMSALAAKKETNAAVEFKKMLNSQNCNEL